MYAPFLSQRTSPRAPCCAGSQTAPPAAARCIAPAGTEHAGWRPRGPGTRRPAGSASGGRAPGTRPPAAGRSPARPHARPRPRLRTCGDDVIDRLPASVGVWAPHINIAAGLDSTGGTYRCPKAAAAAALLLSGRARSRTLSRLEGRPPCCYGPPRARSWSWWGRPSYPPSAPRRHGPRSALGVLLARRIPRRRRVLKPPPGRGQQTVDAGAAAPVNQN